MIVVLLVREIAAGMARSRAATDVANAQVASAGAFTQKLAGAATAMGGIVGVIQGIAARINLLALNATIEADRAGDAGRGFAVVAQEVQSLAGQAARATERIAGEIGGVQAVSRQVGEALDTIQGVVGTMREAVVVAASAMEEQSAVTRDLSANMQDAAQAVAGISRNLSAITGAIGNVSRAVATTKEAAHILVR